MTILIFMKLEKEMSISLSNLSSIPSCMVFDASRNLKNKIEANKFFEDFKLKFKKKDYIGSDYQSYSGSDELIQGCGELTVLCGRALLHGVTKYPYRSKYVMLHLSLFNIYYYLGIVGILRRLLLGKNNPNVRLKYTGLVRTGKFIPSFFILFTNPNANITYHYSVNSQIGYEGFLGFLNSSGKSYAVLRFFENLPQGGRVGGDLDILVDDDLESEAADFLMSNPGTEMVDMYSVSGPSDAARIPYYTPFLSRKILADAVTYNGYKVPNELDYLNSFIYHCLYHKGLSSGIPTSYSDLSVSKSPDNDYCAKIKELSEKVSVYVGDTLEELDDYMASCGWKPHEDTLELLSSSNKWIGKCLSQQTLEREIALSICVLKSGFHDHHSIEKFNSSLEELGLGVLFYDHLSESDKKLAFDHLRGGNWSSSNAAEYSPSDIFVLFDKSRDGVLIRSRNISYNPRYKKLALRKIYDVGHQSHIHMTDNTHQTVQYINVMYKDKLDLFKEQIFAYDDVNGYDARLNLFVYAGYLLKSAPLAIKEQLFSIFKQKM